MKISVIIPFFNAQNYIAKAVKSVLIQPQVAEVVLVNDGSLDNSLKIIQELQLIDNRIKIFHHPHKKNKGRSASRNLGIRKATQPFIAFLDADDFYLPDRFKNDAKLFEENPNADAFYNAIGAHYYNEMQTDKNLDLYSVKVYLKPEELFENLINGRNGHFSIIGLTVKTSSINKIGYFNESLKVAEDTEWMWKLVLLNNVYPSSIFNAVSMRGVHQNNSFNQTHLYQKFYLKMYASLIFWSRDKKVKTKHLELLLKWYWLLVSKRKYNLFKECWLWLKMVVPNSKLLFSILGIKYFPLIQKRKKILSWFKKQ